MGIDYKTPIANEFLELRAELGTALFALLTLANDTHSSPTFCRRSRACNRA